LNSLSYQRALERIQAEYREMPGMRLTTEQVQRLCGVDRAICLQVLEDLVRARFLECGRDHRYARPSEYGSSSIGVSRLARRHGS
jgi:hypothetical protein